MPVDASNTPKVQNTPMTVVAREPNVRKTATSCLRYSTIIINPDTKLNAATATKKDSNTNIVNFCTAMA